MPKEKKLPTNVKEALASIQNLSDTGGNSLDLSHKGLSPDQLAILIPEIKKKLPNLKGIDLSNNKLNELPAEISQLNHLVSIHLISNNLSQLPDKLFDIPNLGGIFLDDNNLATIPESIIQLNKIYDLSLKGNPISQETITFLEESFTGTDGWVIYDLPSKKNVEESTKEETSNRASLTGLTRTSNEEREERSAKKRKPNPIGDKSSKSIAKRPLSSKL